MQPSYVLLPATSYPKTVEGMCYAIVGWLDSNEMPTGCYAYLMKIRYLIIQQCGQPFGRSDMCDGSSQS